MSRSGRARGQTRWLVLVAGAVALFAIAFPPHRVSALPTLGRLSYPLSQVDSRATVINTGQGGLEVRITKLTPLVPTPKSTLNLVGTVTNVSDQQVAQPSVALRVSATPLVTRSEITTVVSGESSREGTRIPGATAQLDGPLDSGESAHFTLSVKMATLRLPRAGAYLVAAEALGDGGDGLVRQDLERTFIGWWPPETTASRIGLNLIWPISSRPDRDGTGTFLSDSLALAVSPTGRLANLVEAGSEHTGALTWLLDPEVLQATSVMSSGYLYYAEADDSAATEGDRDREAAQWLAQLRAAVTADGAHALAGLYATPDVDAAQSSNALPTLLSQETGVNAQTADLLDSELPSSMAWLPGGNAASDTLVTLRERGIRSVVMSDAALPLRTGLNYTPTGAAEVATESGAVRALLLDSALSQTLAMPAENSADVVALRQRLVAETLVTALEMPNLSRIVAASPPLDWAPTLSGARAVLRVVDSAPWIKPVSTKTALKSAGTTPSRTHAELSESQLAEQLPASYGKAARANQRDVAAYRRLLADPDDLPAVLAQAPSRQLSAWFRAAPDPRAALASKVSQQLSTALNSVDVVSTGSITISGQSGTIPVTVSNNGELAVSVGLRLTSEPAILFQADPIEPFQIAPQRRTSVEVPAQLTGSGNIQVLIQPVNSAGETVGTTTTLLVRSAAYARAARLIVQLALVLLVAAVVVHGVRRARRMATAARRPA